MAVLYFPQNTVVTFNASLVFRFIKLLEHCHNTGNLNQKSLASSHHLCSQFARIIQNRNWNFSAKVAVSLCAHTVSSVITRAMESSRRSRGLVEVQAVVTLHHELRVKREKPTRCNYWMVVPCILFEIRVIYQLDAIFVYFSSTCFGLTHPSSGAIEL